MGVTITLEQISLCTTAPRISWRITGQRGLIILKSKWWIILILEATDFSIYPCIQILHTWSIHYHFVQSTCGHVKIGSYQKQLVCYNELYKQVRGYDWNRNLSQKMLCQHNENLYCVFCNVNLKSPISLEK